MNQPGSRVKASTALSEGASSIAPGGRAGLRRTLRRARRALDEHTGSAHAAALAKVLAGSPEFRNARRIAAYLASDGEIDLQPLIEQAWSRSQRIYLPVLHGRRLQFQPFAADTPLVANRYRIPEPALAARTCWPARGLDLVIVPLVGFDASGNRLGMGAGYYDRTFAFLRRRRHWRRPLLIGAAHALQCVEALPARPWDVPLDGVATERGLQRFRHGG